MNLGSAVVGLIGVLLGVGIKYVLDARSESKRIKREDRLRFLDIKRDTYAKMGARVVEQRYRIEEAQDEVSSLRAELEEAKAADLLSTLDVDGRFDDMQAKVDDLKALINETGTELRGHMAALQLIAPQQVVDAARKLVDLELNEDEKQATWDRWVDACRADLEGREA